MLDDPVIGASKLIAEPWDVGPADGRRQLRRRLQRVERPLPRPHARLLAGRPAPRARRRTGSGIGRFATRLAGSSNTFAAERGPLASLNFITAHDGFTLADLTAYDAKHNLGNGEHNRDGTDHNNSYNHGVEGPTDDAGIAGAPAKHPEPARHPAALGGVPMLTAGDEYGRSQRGNNNAYCHDPS